ncbi:MAG: hypothetical protein ACREBG_29820 [Pyrinomonadaceae bacterium]
MNWKKASKIQLLGSAGRLSWGGIKNGDLLQRAEGEFDLFITSDQNLRYQQNLTDRRIAIFELSTNDIGRIQAASSLIETAIDKIQPNEF